MFQQKSCWSRDVERQNTNTTQVKNKSQSFTSPKPQAIKFILKPYPNMPGMKMLSVIANRALELCFQNHYFIRCVYIFLLICKSLTRCKKKTQTHLIANDTVLRFISISR